MEKISIDRLRQLLEKENVELEIAIKNKPDESCHIGFDMDLVITGSGGELKVAGYNIEVFKNEKLIEKSFKKIDKLFAYLKKEQVIDDGDITVITYNNHYQTYQDYLDALAFDNIDMTGLLEKYLPHADRFSLTCPYSMDYDIDHPYGTCRLNKEHADYAEKMVRERTMQSLLRIYEKISEADKESLPSFDTLMESITNEVENYRAKLSDKELGDNGGSSFMCERFSMGKTYFKSPQELWHFYHSLDNLFMYCWISDKMKKGTVERPLDAELNSEYYSPLKQDLINTEVAFCWHCTTSSQLSKVFYFRITDNSVAWLKKLKNDYDMTELEDLAFYNSDKLLFSSCTHEGFHNDFIDRLDN